MDSIRFSNMFLTLIYVCIFLIGEITAPPAASNDQTRASRGLPEKDQSLGSAPWHAGAQSQLARLLARTPDTRVAKNIVLFLGDGMSAATVSAARALHGQMFGLMGEDSSLSFEEFPYTGLSKTYCLDKQVADSACTSTAYLGGVKANYGTIGVTGAVTRKDCAASADPENHVHSIASWAQKAGKATGIVTTTRVTHASPSGSYGHTSERDWEADSDIIKDGADPNLCPDLAKQLVQGDVGKNFKVILGGGRKNFFPNTTVDKDGEPGVRRDGVDLTSVWQKEKSARGISSAYVTDRNTLLGASQMADAILGLFDADHMQYHLESDAAKHPTLAEMTTVAIQMLSKEERGFFLFVEGGRIDHAHHDNLARKALDETIQFSEAIKSALSILDKDTLVVVTADHAHTMSYAGYAKRGSDILGFGGVGLDGLPYTTLAYANGPSYKPEKGGRYNLSKDDTHHLNYTFPAPVPLESETHGGEDVEVFAHGPWSHLFTGLYEQNVIPHTMAFASCIGPGLTACSLN